MKPSTTRSVDQLVDLLSHERTIWVRLAGMRPEEEWRLGLLDMTAGEAPPSWQRRRWLYDRACFIALAVKGSTAARWFKTRRLSLRPLRIGLDGLADQITVDRHESWWAGLQEALPWPSEVWRLADTSQHAGHPWGALVADGAPAFIDFNRATAFFLGLGSSPNRNFSGSELVFRRQDRRGRIAAVQISPSDLRVRLEGDGLAKSIVELAGDAPGPSKRIARAGPRLVTFPLAEGLPRGAWVALRRGDELLDRRLLDVVTPQPGVDVQIAPMTRLEVLIAGGEGTQVEFKRALPSDDRESVRTAMKTVAAFANGAGGSILFGIDDEGAIVGIQKMEAASRGRDRIAGWVSSWVKPLVDFRIESVAAPGRPSRAVVILTVDEGPQPPYCAGPTAREFTYYVRRGATTFPAAPEVVRTLARSRPAPEFSSLRRIH